MKLQKPLIGIIAFLIVLFTMPLGHAAMILMETGFGHEYVYHAAIILGFIGLGLLLRGLFSSNETTATILGFFAGVFIWTGWVEFAYVYYANRFGVEPYILNGEVITKPEYLIMPSSVGMWSILIIYYFVGTKTGCTFFIWFQKKLGISKRVHFKPAERNVAVTTFMEVSALLWTFYLLLLFVFDPNFFGDRHIATYIVAFGSLFWSLYLFLRLLKKNNMAYAIRYAIPTVIIFWNFVEILGRWNLFREIWVEPMKYWLEMTIVMLVFVALVSLTVFERRRKHSGRNKINPLF
jgi:hypothetical protein